MPQQEQNIPSLRFPEFKEKWKETTLGKVSKFSKGRGISKNDIDPDGKTHCIRYGELYTDYDTVIDIPISKTSVPREELVLSEGNEVIIPASGETSKDIATAAVVLRKDIALGGDLNIIKSDNDGTFLAFYLSGKKRLSLAAMAQGNSVVHLYTSQLGLLPLHLPKDKREQQKIAAFLGAVGEKIAQLQKKKDLLEVYKKGCMQKLFTQDIRFNDDKGSSFPDWEIKTLGSTVDLIGGLTYSPNNIVEKGMLVLRSSNVQNAKILLDDNVYVDLDVETEKKTQVDDILLCVRNGSQRLIGKSAIIKQPMQNATHGAFMTVLRGKQNNFVFQLLQTQFFFKEVYKNLGATINSINGADLKKMKFSVPASNKEKKKIADFLSAIDDKIALVSEELDKAKTFKKGLLQQMFV